MMNNGILLTGHNARLQAADGAHSRVHLSVTGAAPLRLIAVMLDDQGRAIHPAPLLTWRIQNPNLKISLTKGEAIRALIHTAAIAPPIQSILFLVAPYGRAFFNPREKIFTAIASEGTDPLAIESIAPAETMHAAAICEFYWHPQQGVKVRARDEWRHRDLPLLLERMGVPTAIISEQMLYPLPHARHTDAARSTLKDFFASAPEISRTNNVMPDDAHEPAPVLMPQESHPLQRAAAGGTPAQTTPPPSPQPPPAAANPAPQTSAVSPEIMRLEQVGEQHRITATGGRFGAVKAVFTWHQRLATRAAVTLDFGCFWELENGQKGQIGRAVNQFGTTTQAPYIALDHESETVGALRQETLRMDGNAWPDIRRLLIYAAILEGPVQWDPLDGQIMLSIPDHPPIAVEIMPGEKHGPVSAIVQLENRSNQMRVLACGGCFDSHIGLDQAHEFGVHWQENTASYDPRVTHFDQTHRLDWQPRAPRTLWAHVRKTFLGGEDYAQAEGAMQAVLAGAALVMIADGRVSEDEKKEVVDCLISLPLGRYFSEFEIRKTMDVILSDLKNRRKLAETAVLKILAAYRRAPETDIIIYALRKIALHDGHVSIQEERMVERLTRYLQG